MNISQPFIDRPVATTLLTLGVALAGAIAFRLLPVAPLPQVDFPTISVQASLPGASPETMAATVATPLERALGRIAGVTEITSSSSLGSTRITLQFDLNRDIDGAARDVQAAINAARSLLPSGLPNNPTYRKVNPADAPIMIVALTSDTMTRGQIYDAASTVLAQKLSQIEGVDTCGDRHEGDDGSHAGHSRLAPRGRANARHRGRAGDPRRVPVSAQRSRSADSKRGGAGVADWHVRRHVSRRIQSQQPVTDGAHGRHRVRRRRRDCRARERFTPHRTGDGAARGGADRGTRSRFHRLVDEPLADRGVHSDAVDGRHP